MPPDLIDLDAHATTPLCPEAREAMLRAWDAGGANPSSGHHLGRAARRILDAARETVAAHLGADPERVLFTGGATEANNLAIFGQVPAAPGRVLAGKIEHPCVLGPLAELAKRGVGVEWLPVTERGQVVPPIPCPAPDLSLVALMLANHETGAIQPVAELAALAKSCGAPLHCDAAQAVGKVPVSLRELGASTLALSAHKFGGPVGVGALLLAPGVSLRPQVFGGHQQQALRPGTEPVALAAGLAAALDAACRSMSARAERLTRFRRLFLAELEAHAGPVAVNGPRPGDADGLPSCLNVSFDGLRADLLLMRLDLEGVACSAGSACASGSLLPSPVLTAMRLPEARVRAAVRFSFGAALSADDAEEASARVVRAVRALRGQ